MPLSDVFVGGGAFDAPVVLQRKTALPKAIKRYFPAENPEMWYISGWVVVGADPYGGDWEVSNLNQPTSYVILSKGSASKNLHTERYVSGRLFMGL